MLKSVLDLFRDKHEEKDTNGSVELATAVLLSEIIRADRESDERELKAYRVMLTKQFKLDEQALHTLMDEGRESAEEAVDMVQFTQVINQQCDNDQKQAILKSLWEVAYADKDIAPIEEHTIRRIADLLYIPHSQYIKTKLAVTDEK
ncbi:TerB family tellurite resistance protein [Alteromonas pelagimontana]|uniref:TerB family tellurite resistance protein n=1 Tax=Alteromonas pelagimontana TaxID=1858656 RepID=A0A6M4M9J3_9ALTE|nr:TerB family tellurite resistance protein [Alteromonas pelagimontana]QJR79833.1 TerB family tellurite resistance protein [Alteromonas pelagimontana]